MRTISDYEQLLKRARQSGDRDLEENALGSLGNMYAQQGNIYKGIECHTEALKINKSMGDHSGMSLSYLSLASIYDAALGDLQTAVKYAEQAVAFATNPHQKSQSAEYLEGLRYRITYR